MTKFAVPSRSVEKPVVSRQMKPCSSSYSNFSSIFIIHDFPFSVCVFVAVCAQTEDAGVEAAEAKREGTREIEPRPLLANAFSSSSARGQDVRAYCGGRLELVLSTAILSITQRVTDMERGASARVREVETAAREALEEAQRQVRRYEFLSWMGLKVQNWRARGVLWSGTLVSSRKNKEKTKE